MAAALTITLAQINPTVGALSANTDKMREVWKNAQSDLVVFSEMALCGYPPEDLVLKPAFLDEIERHVGTLIEFSRNTDTAALIMTPYRAKASKDKPHSDIIHDEEVHNCALLIHHGEILHTISKHRLANYGVFDEKRTFIAGPMPQVIEFKDTRLAVPICEDFWHEDVIASLAAQKPDVLITPNGSPFTVDKQEMRAAKAREVAKAINAPVIYINQVGGQDDLVFDGASFVMDAEGALIHQLKSFEEDVFDYRPGAPAGKKQDPDALQNIYDALVLGLHDYVRKNGFSGVLLGLSGGIDSALSAVIAAEAIGAENVQCVMMPSPFTSQDSLDDAKAQAETLGCPYEIISIEKPMEAFEATIPNLSGTAHENMQSRTRGLILMALSNSNGKMVLSTGNKSEMAVGYATLYGDMCGGFNALKDLYKTQVYALSEWINREREIIPARIITKAPTAELKDNQTDQDSLPEYDALDDILECLIEREMVAADIVARGHDEATVSRVWRMLDLAEYKRRQAPPGVKITSRAFGRDRRYPITNRFFNHRDEG